MVVPGRKKCTSVVVVLLTAVNKRCALNVCKSLPKPNSGGVANPALPLTRKPLPGVLNTTPRGELTLKKMAGNALESAVKSGAPSQLISRRRPPNAPFAAPVLPPPWPRETHRAWP